MKLNIGKEVAAMQRMTVPELREKHADVFGEPTRCRHKQRLVLPKGFDYEGEVYRSLSAVAKAVTGTHWNGYHFFGLKQKGASGNGAVRSGVGDEGWFGRQSLVAFSSRLPRGGQRVRVAEASRKRERI